MSLESERKIKKKHASRRSVQPWPRKYAFSRKNSAQVCIMATSENQLTSQHSEIKGEGTMSSCLPVQKNSTEF